VRESLRAHRFLFLCRPERLSAAEQDTLTALLASPVGAPLRVARAFLLDWRAIWRDDDGRKHTPAETEARYTCVGWLPHPRSKAMDRAVDKAPGHRVSTRCDQAASVDWSWHL